MNKTLLAFSLCTALTITPSFASISGTEQPASPSTETTDQLNAEQQAYLAWAENFEKNLHPQTGKIALANGVATLDVPDNFYYLSPEESEKVLAEAWGNPPGQTTLGMLFPAGASPLDGQTWGVTIQYEEDGYVSDENAGDINYDELLTQMQSDVRESNKQRQQAGYEAIDLVGWATSPRYNPDTHKMYWAKELKFGDDEEHTLNYNIRLLGRQGVLVLNFIASMPQLPDIERSLNEVLDIAEFDQGNRYEDFNPELDKVAAYGIGALVAGKVLAKTGLIAAALIFLKKFGVIIVVAAGGLLSRVFKGKKSS